MRGRREGDERETLSRYREYGNEYAFGGSNPRNLSAEMKKEKKGERERGKKAEEREREENEYSSEDKTRVIFSPK